MDEEAFRETCREVNARPCAFAKAIQIRCAECSRARKLLLAERESFTCLSPAGEERCRALLGALRQKALFALKLTHLDGPLPHGKEIKVQCGGLIGLRTALGGGPAADIDSLLEQAHARFGAQLPLTEMVQAIASYTPRPRR